MSNCWFERDYTHVFDECIYIYVCVCVCAGIGGLLRYQVDFLAMDAPDFDDDDDEASFI